MIWAWIGIGVVGWCVVAVVVGLVVGRGIRTADRLARPQIDSAPRIAALRTTTPDHTRPDGSGQTRGQSAASDDVWELDSCSHSWEECAETFIPTGSRCCIGCTGHTRTSVTERDR